MVKLFSARILCVLTAFLLLNGIAFTFFHQEEIILSKSQENEHKITHKSDLNSLLLKEIEDDETFSDDDETEKEFSSHHLIFAHQPIEFYFFIDKSEKTNFNIPQKSFVKSIPRWLETRQILI